MLCIGLVGCGSGESEDAQEVSAAADTEQAAEVEEIDETASNDDSESDEEDQNAVADMESDIDAETDSAESGSDTQKDADDSETDIEPKEPSLPEYEVTELEEPVVMYASNSVNVRQDSSTDFEIVGSLKPGWDVTVTGQADTGWYEILYNEKKVFVSNQYLQNEKPEEEPVINLGVNDPGNIQNYLALVNAKAEEWTGKGATVYYASVNPVWENPYVTEEQVKYFNSQLQNGLSGNVHYIDSHSYLESIGYGLVDGLHYNGETYQNLYAYYMSCM